MSTTADRNEALFNEVFGTGEHCGGCPYLSTDHEGSGRPIYGCETNDYRKCQAVGESLQRQIADWLRQEAA